MARRLTRRFDRKALVLMYHRVDEADSDPWSLCVTPQRFAEHLQVLRQRTRPLPLRRLTGALASGKVPRRSVIVTFDDGYADNLYNARPLLERYDIPATVFIATAYLEQDRQFWWDELERIFLQPGRLPEHLQLRIEGESCRWQLGADAIYSEEACRQHRGWRAGHDAPTSRHAIYFSLWQRLQSLRDCERRQVLGALEFWASGRPADPRPARTLGPREAIALAQGDLVEIGSHTVTHPVLSALPVAAQRSEIQQSKTSLEEILGRPVTSFAYPYGARCNYTDESVSTVRQAGYTCACSTLTGVVEAGADCFELPRVQVEDWDGDEFAKRLSGWLDGP